jgi:DNA-binding XRE family transcriptional regulator
MGLSQSDMAALIGVSPESYRVWESGRRPVPPGVTDCARTAVEASRRALLSMTQLAACLQVHPRTLRAAARNGRLAVTYDTRSAFGRPVPRATVAAGEAFKRQHYRRTTRWTPPVVGPTWSVVPENYDAQLVGLRMRLGLTQSELAERIGAASKAVVYQWESRKRVPSPVLWARAQRLRAPSASTAHGRRTAPPTHGSSTPHVR